MFMKKIKNNNKAGSPINFFVVIMLSMTLILMLLDIINYSRAKSVLTSETEYLASVVSFQGGLQNSSPYGWTDIYSVSYIPFGNAKSYFSTALNKTAITKPKIRLGGTELTRAFTLSYKQKSTFSGEGKYVLEYLKVAGFNKKEVTLKHDVPVCGFWLYRNTNL